jgi:hypothetical protein
MRDKISESNCDVIWLQETKRENFDIQFIRKFCPPSFEFLPSVGASGAVLTVWKSQLFQGHLAFSSEYSISMEFTYNHNDVDWVLLIGMGHVHQRASNSLLSG